MLMKGFAFKMLFATLVLAPIHGGLLHAAEIQLREDVHSAGPLVLLGEIADVHARHSVEAAELSTIDLFPTPPPGERRVLRLRELQDVLAVRGMNLGEHRFSGASQITIHGPRRDDLAPVSAPRQSKQTRKIVADRNLIESQICEAIQAYLNEKAGDQGWQVAVQLSDSRATQIASLGEAPTVTGGKEPWTGKQQFEISATNGDDDSIQVVANVELPPTVVVARYSLPKGVVLRADDVTLQRGEPTQGEATVYQSIEDVIGKETVRSITEGQILDSRSLRQPLLVRRNEVVTVYSRCEGVSVRTTARVRDDGANGDLVTVETLEDRKPFFARVSGPQEVSVFAQAIAAEEPTLQPAQR
jgi:flagella basal body P-ring formation protein FlgA